MLRVVASTQKQVCTRLPITFEPLEYESWLPITFLRALNLGIPMHTLASALQGANTPSAVSDQCRSSTKDTRDAEALALVLNPLGVLVVRKSLRATPMSAEQLYTSRYRSRSQHSYTVTNPLQNLLRGHA